MGGSRSRREFLNPGVFFFCFYWMRFMLRVIFRDRSFRGKLAFRFGGLGVDFRRFYSRLKD